MTEEQTVIRRKVRVTIEKEIIIDLAADNDTPENIQGWCDAFWDIEGVDDIATYAARMAAQHGGGHSFDGIGYLNDSNYPHEPDTRFKELWSNVETEIIDLDESEKLT